MKNVFERIFMHGMDGVLVVHPGRDVLRANPAACAMLGRTEKELQHAARDSILVDTAELRDSLARRDGGTPVRGNVRMLRADGSAFEAEFTSGLMPDSDDQLAYLIFRDVSHRWAMQSALQASEARYRRFFETVLEGVAYVTPAYDAQRALVTWRFVEANPAMHVLLGRTTLRGQTVHEVFGDRAARRMAVYSRVLETGEPEQLELRINDRVLLSRFSRHSETLVCVSTLDVTEQRHAEHELLELVASANARAAELRAVLDAAPTAIWITRDASGEQIEPNRYAAALQRLPSDTLLKFGDPEFERLVHFVPLRNGVPFPTTEFPARVAARTGAPVLDTELELAFDDGSIRHLYGSAMPILAADGSPCGAVSAFVDITERKASEQALADALGRFDAFMNAMPTLAWAKDTEGRFLYVNAAWQRVTGFSCDEAMGRTVPELLPVSDPLQAEREDGYVLATGKPLVSLTEMRDTATGELRWWQTVRFIIMGADGHRHLGGIGTDITEQKEHEQSLRASEARARAAQLALEEATELTRRTEANFRQAQKMDAIGQLAGGVAHDFNNLLTVILGNSEMLAEVLHDHALRGEIEEIQHAGTRAATLTRQLLAFSRRQPLEPRVLSLNTLLRGMERMFARLLGEQYEMVTVLHPELSRCFVDAGQVEQVVLNLVLNARDAMPEGGRITVETSNVTLDADFLKDHPTASGGPQVLLSVSDDGCGMSADTLPHIFEPFFTTKAAGKGTGLGLSTAYGIVKQSGGNIWVDSEPGRGTSVHVYFPCANGAEPMVPGDAVALHDFTGHETILLSEDDTLVRSTVAGMLRRAGYHVVEASNGTEALQICEHSSADIALVITDVIMPRMNGRELADRLHILKPTLRVLYISGYSENVVVHQGMVDSGINYLQKPFTAEMLLPKVREVLNRRVATG